MLNHPTIAQNAVTPDREGIITWFVIATIKATNIIDLTYVEWLYNAVGPYPHAKRMSR